VVFSLWLGPISLPCLSFYQTIKTIEAVQEGHVAFVFPQYHRYP
jgi:hypothetical protein